MAQSILTKKGQHLKRRSFLMVAMLSGACILRVGPLAAAPFCIEAQGFPSECWYHDIKSCREEAGKKNGICSVNLKEVKVSGSGAPFCIIDSAMRPFCAFQNWENCENEAARSSAAVCFRNAAIASTDPYRFDRMIYQKKR